MAGVLPNLAFYILPFLLVVGVVVTIHEFGHFLAAKALGTKIDQFSIGFGKAFAHWTDKSGVEWRLGWLPIGGFVRFAGDENAASVPDQNDLEEMRRDLVRREGEAALGQYYHFKPIWQRAVISAAGPFANFLLAVAVFAGTLMIFGEPMAPARIGSVVAGGPAAAAGFQSGDTIVAVGGRLVKSPSDVKSYVILRSDVAIPFVVQRDGKSLTLVATPRRGPVQDALGKWHQLGRLQLAFDTEQAAWHTKHYGPVGAVLRGVEQTREVIDTTVFYVGRMIAGHESADQISGPLGMAQVSGDIAKQTAHSSSNLGIVALNGLLAILNLIATISVGIGFLNLLPIPVLDGGHLLFYAYEAVARRPLAAKVQAAGYRVGLALVLGLMLFATWNDLQRLRVFNFIGGLFS